MPSVSQLNVRMNTELKAAGDSVLELYGIAPSELIRALWAKIAHGEQALDQVVRVLAANPAAGSVKTTNTTAPTSHLSKFVQQRQAGFEQELGLDPATYVPLSNDQLDDLVYLDFLDEEQPEGAKHAI